MKIFKSKIIFFIMFMTLLLIPSESFAWSTCTISLNDWDLVDSGKHLDWSGSSKYVSQFNSAVNVWNSHKSGVIRKDTALTVNDLTISDQGYIADGVAARTYSNGKIKFATQYMDNLSSSEKLHTCIHELGHALRLAHRSGEASSVMQAETANITTLCSCDKTNYDEAYKKY